jgi:hypothetical protein
VILAVSLLWSSREWKAWLVAAMLLAAGLFWSSIDPRCCSAWWKGKIVYQKVSGQFSYLSWPDILRQVSAPCFAGGDRDQKGTNGIKLLEEKVVEGRKRELY